MRIIGDVHGNTDRYLQAIDGVDASIQIGDMGFDYTHMYRLNYKKHVFFRGNHDLVDNLPLNCLKKYGHNKGDYHSDVKDLNFFYVSGGYSVDRKVRTEGVNWWADEELSYRELGDCIHDYKDVFDYPNLSQDVPDIVLSHEAPITPIQNNKDVFSTDILVNWGYHENWSSKTAHALETIWELHKPKLWIFGHFHVPFDKVIDGTRFICLPECGYCDILNNGDVLETGQF